MTTDSLLRLTSSSLSFVHTAMEELERRKIRAEMTRTEEAQYNNLVSYRAPLPGGKPQPIPTIPNEDLENKKVGLS